HTLPPRTVIHSPSLHDALPISHNVVDPSAHLVCTEEGTKLGWVPAPLVPLLERAGQIRAEVMHVNASDSNPHLRLLVRVTGELLDRKSTRLNSSHVSISYAVFC